MKPKQIEIVPELTETVKQEEEEIYQRLHNQGFVFGSMICIEGLG